MSHGRCSVYSPVYSNCQPCSLPAFHVTSHCCFHGRDMPSFLVVHLAGLANNVNQEQRKAIPIYRRVASTGLSLFVLLVCSYSIYRPATDNTAQPDPVQASMRRYAPLKPHLPAFGPVCFLPGPNSGLESKRNFTIAQYALAPVVLRPDDSCDLLVVDGVPPEIARARYPLFSVRQTWGRDLELMRKIGVKR